MVDWGVETEGLDELIVTFVNMAKEYKRIVVRQFGKLGRFVAYLCQVELRDVRYTGALEGSFVVDVEPTMRTEIYPTAGHALFVRRGTRPHWAPIGPLKAWAAAKLGDEDAAYPVQRSIATHGTSMYQARKRGTKSNPWPKRVVARSDFQAALQQMTEELGVEIVEELVA